MQVKIQKQSIVLGVQRLECYWWKLVTCILSRSEITYTWSWLSPTPTNTPAPTDAWRSHTLHPPNISLFPFFHGVLHPFTMGRRGTQNQLHISSWTPLWTHTKACNKRSKRDLGVVLSVHCPSSVPQLHYPHAKGWSSSLINQEMKIEVLDGSSQP